MLIKNKLWLLVPTLALLFGCQTNHKNNSHGERKVASLFEQISAEEGAELDGKFENIFEDLLVKFNADNSSDKSQFQNDLQGHEVDPFNRVAILILKRSFYYLKQLDINLAKIANDCRRDRARSNNPEEVKCQSIMDDPNYSKLWASRIINERNQRQLWYYYVRMLDIANAEEGSAGMPSTLEFMAKDFPSYQAMAKATIQIWNQNVDEFLTLDRRLENPANFDLVSNVFDLREDALATWNALFNRSYEYRTLAIAYPQFVEEYQKESVIKEMYDKAQLNESTADEKLIEEEGFDDTVKEIADSIAEAENKRSPNAVDWKNHTGRGFARGEWALTYDDGPGGRTTRDIIDILRGKGWHATFFWLAKNVGNHPQSVKYALDNGMSLANHSYTHADLSKRSSNLDREIVESQRVLKQAYTRAAGRTVEVNYFRAPYGAGLRGPRLRQLVQRNDMEHFFWNVDTLDWQSSTPEQVYQRTINQMETQGCGIILFHDIHKRTVATTKLMAQRMSNLNIVRLGPDGRNGILHQANGSSTGGGTPPPNPQPTGPEFPKRIKINVRDNLNVRTEPSSRRGAATICGEFYNGETATVTGRASQDPNWYVLSGVDNSTHASRGNGRNRVSGSGNCNGNVFIHGGYTSDL